VILVDTSAWIEFQRATGSTADRRVTLVAEADQKGEGAPFRTLPWLVVGPCVLVALLALTTPPAADRRPRERHA